MFKYIKQFKILKNEKSDFLFSKTTNSIYFLAWTTTPWTLPSNTALAVGKEIDYLLIDTFNQYTGKAITIVNAKDLYPKYFNTNNAELKFKDYKIVDKNIPYSVNSEFKGSDFGGLKYEQLLKSSN